MSQTHSPEYRPVPLWLRLVVLLFAVLFAAGGAIALVRPAMLVSPSDEINAAVRIYAGYLAARDLAIAAMLIAALAMGARRLLASLLVLAGLVQLLDTAMDCLEGRWIVAPGVFVLGLICLSLAARLTPFWRIEDWQS